MTMRRDFMAFAAGAVAAKTVPMRTQEAADPVLVLYREYLELDRESEAVHRIHSAKRQEFVARHGECIRNPHVQALWKSDPQRGELDRLVKVSNVASDRLCDATEAVVDAAPTTLEGLRAKVLVALDLFPSSHDEWFEKVAQDVLKEVATWLAASAAPVMGRA